MKLTVEFLVFKRLMPKMPYIWVEEQPDKFIMLGRIDNQDLICTHIKSAIDEENLIVTNPCYMLADTIYKVYVGAQATVEAMLGLIRK